MPSIFLSYRRHDSAGHAGRLYDALVRRYGSDQVFIDIGTIEPGRDFVEVIHEAIASHDTMLVLIGPRWLMGADGHGQKRIEDPADFVRLEVATALQSHMRVIPVLVQGARMPAPTRLPEDLLALVRRNAFELSDTRWAYDVQRLIEVLDRVHAPANNAAMGQAEGPATNAQHGPHSSDGAVAKAPLSYDKALKVGILAAAFHLVPGVAMVGMVAAGTDSASAAIIATAVAQAIVTLPIGFIVQRIGPLSSEKSTWQRALVVASFLYMVTIVALFAMALLPGKGWVSQDYRLALFLAEASPFVGELVAMPVIGVALHRASREEWW